MAAPDPCLLTPELWFVNTRFSCLCTRSNTHSFVPRWRPPFITALAPEDRCHLNGLCMAEGRPAFVTALGATDTPGGWRADKKSGGILMEVETGEIITRGLSMPHSPRWHNGRLWVLESGSGGFGWIDPATGKYQQVAVLPGFTRGLGFCGPLAFIGLSQVRESAVFSGIAIAERPLEERCCGVWVVNIQTGETVAYVKFEDALQEIFAVQVLPGVRHPDLINDQPRLIADSFVVPDAALDLVPAPLRHAARENREPTTHEEIVR
ncbi:MAG: TIGR03032 family protein [Gemmataceae bacterium]|nr:TIGR03032 family protein [Gemmataceae bacterium]